MAGSVLLLMPTTTYHATDLLEAARRLGVEVVVGSDRRQALEHAQPGRTIALDFRRPRAAVKSIERLAAARPLDAIVGADDETVELAALAAAALGLPHNPVAAARASRDKWRCRELWREAGLRGPWFRRVALDDDPRAVAATLRYPCVVKPTFLSAGRGVLRADDPASFAEAFRTAGRLLRRPEIRRRGGPAAEGLLVEGYLDGPELSLEGLLVAGTLHTLALFDKPDTPRGPTFEETIFVTPSRLPPEVQRAVRDETARAAAALGLVHGPVHAELRVTEEGPVMLELAARSIGGLCSRALRFGAGATLEELILRQAVEPGEVPPARESGAAGVMMIPTPRSGILRAVPGRDEALAVPGIEDVVVSRPLGSEVEPLPEGHRYLGFIFARAAEPAAVEAALREAYRRLDPRIEPPRTGC